MAQDRGRTKNSGNPRDIAEVEIYRFDEGAWIATGVVEKVPSNLYFVADEWCAVNDYIPERGPTERRLTATENLHGPFPVIERTPLEEARHKLFVQGEIDAGAAADAATPEQ